MDGRWRSSGPHMPERIRSALRGTRRRTGSARAVGVGVGVVVAVLIVAVASSTLLAPDQEGSSPSGAGAAIEVPVGFPELSASSPAPSGSSPSPSKSPSGKPSASPSKSTGEPKGEDKEGDDGGAASGPSFPGGGTYDIQPAHTGLCLGIGPEINNPRDRPVLVQDSCGQAKPSLTMVKVSDDVVRFTLYFSAEDWTACLVADTPGDLYAAGECNGGSAQTYTLVPAGSGRYLVKSKATGKCMDFPWYRDTEGAQVAGAACSTGSASQRFAFN